MLVFHGKVSFLIFLINNYFYSIFIFVYILESLFGCFDDIGTCCCGLWCLPCLFGTNAEKIDGSNCVGMSILYCVLGYCYLCWIPHMEKRKKLRQKYFLREEPCNDCLVTACCGGCSVCQEARELKARGMQSRNFNTISSVFLCVKF